MTIMCAHGPWSPIGAMELKSSYHRNMLLATASVILFFAVIVGGLAIGKLLSADDNVLPVTVTILIDPAELGLPPALVEKVVQVLVSLEKSAPAFTIPEAVDDADVVDDFVIAAPEDYANLSPSSNIDLGSLGGFTLNNASIEEILPPRDSFVAYDENPVIVSLSAPKYPEMARKAEIQGTVYVEVLIDTRGKVRDARVVKESGANAGFEEAALEAAWKGEWRPAMQNKQPVAVRVSYPVVFRLK